MIMKAIDNNNLTHSKPPIYSFTTRSHEQKINKLSIIPQKVNYNPIMTKCQAKKSKNIQKNEK